MRAAPRIFLSYARKDGEAFTTALRRHLEREHPGLTLWQDRDRLEGGIGWWKQIEEALDAVKFLVVVMTPAALASETTRKEWRYARQKGLHVYPVMGVPSAQIPWTSMPKWMSKAHFFEAGTVAGGEFQPGPEWDSFIRNLQTDHPPPRVPFMAPDLPEGFVPRPAELDQLLHHLLAADRQNPVAITTALAGAGGFGKTTLAIALCHHDDVITAFDDGILWATLGEKPDVKLELTKIYAALTGERPPFLDEEEAARELGLKLQSRNCLLVVDDVWQAAHLRPFLRGGRDCARLIATRQFEVLAEAHAEARRVNVDEMRSQEAVDVLSGGLVARPADRAPLRALARRLGEWPLLLGLANGALRQRIARGDTLAWALDYLGQALDRHGLTAFDQRNATERHGAVSKTVGVSLDLLTPEERDCYAELAIFPEDTDVPLSAIGKLWRKDGFETEQLVTALANFSLLKFGLQHGTLRLHDVLRSYLARQLTEPTALHRRLLSGWRDFHKLPDEYAWRWVAWHLVQAGQAARLRELLFDFNWLQAKLDATDVGALIADFDQGPKDEELKLVQGAVRLSARAVRPDKNQLAGQLVGRLSGDAKAAIQRLVARARGWRGTPWLRPKQGNLHPPGTVLLSILAAHSDPVTAVAVSPDSRIAVSASRDRTLKVWELASGGELRTLAGHSGGVAAVAVSPDGRLVVSASADQTLRIWDLASGRELCALEGHTGGVKAVAVSPDGRLVVSASDDRTLRVWDLVTGRELHVLEGHCEGVKAVAVSPDSRFAVSASWDRTLKVWELASGRESSTLRGHRGVVTAVAVSPDSRFAVSASWDRTLKVWELASGRELRTFRGHRHMVTVVAISADGRLVVSASNGHSLKVWELESGRELRTLCGHGGAVRSLAVSGDGRLAVSASEDGTLKVWELASGQELRTLAGHSNLVSAVAVSPDGRLAVSASYDRTLRVWELASGKELPGLEAQGAPAGPVPLTQDGRLDLSVLGIQAQEVGGFLSGSDLHSLIGVGDGVGALATTPAGRLLLLPAEDHSLKAWDAASGDILRTICRHDGLVNAVVVSPDQRIVVSASADRTLKVCALGSRRRPRTFRGHSGPVNAAAISPDRRLVVSASDDQTLKVWDLASGRELRELVGHSGSVNAVALSPDGRLVLSASSDWTVKIWELASGRVLRTLVGHNHCVNEVAVGPDGRVAVSASDDWTLKIWDLTEGRLLATFTADGAVLRCGMAPDGRSIVANDESSRIHFLYLVLPEDPVECEPPISDGGIRSADGGLRIEVRQLEPGRSTKGKTVSKGVLSAMRRAVDSAASERKRRRKTPSRRG